MTEENFRRAPWKLNEAKRTTYGNAYAESSVSSLIPSDLTNVACVDACAWLSSICADESPRFHETVRTLHSNDCGVLVLEFRADAVSFPCIYRRLYNIVIGLCSHNHANMDQIRASVDYAIVLRNAQRRYSTVSESISELSAGLYGTQRERWDFDAEDLQHSGPDERRFSGLICRKAYQIFSSELDDFAAKKGIVV